VASTQINTYHVLVWTQLIFGAFLFMLCGIIAVFPNIKKLISFLLSEILHFFNADKVIVDLNLGENVHQN
jgi:hypothetical protein